jgi:hypothetical protein
MESCADSADASTDDVSDQSGHQSNTGSDSEADAHFQAHISSPQQASLTAFANIAPAPPPGLGEAPEQKRKDPSWSRTRTTADLVESQLRARKEAASRIKAAHNVPDNLAALKSALEHLDANEIAKVKSLLDFKVRKQLAASDPPAARPLRTLPGKWGPPQETFRPPRERREPHRIDPEERERRQTQLQEVESSGMNLRTHLRDLAAVESDRVLTLRKISQLGLDSPKLLEEYFTNKFGEVERMMVTPTIGKAAKSQTTTRLRPAPLGFVVMKTVEDAHAALHYKEAHVVNGMEISVLTFNTHTVD